MCFQSNRLLLGEPFTALAMLGGGVVFAGLLVNVFGDRLLDGERPEQRGVLLAFEELGFFSEELKLLGTFPVNPFRRKGWEAPTRPGT